MAVKHLFRCVALVGATAIGASCADRLSLSHSGGEGNPPPPPPLARDHPAIGLVAAAAGERALRVEWQAGAELEDGVDLALFVASDSATILTGTPILVDRAARAATVEGLPPNQTWFCALAQRAASDRAFRATGPILRVRTGAPVYVDPLADPAVADGMTPQTAFSDLLLGIVTAFANGGGNVWVTGGDFDAVSAPLFGGVHVFGGFDSDFRLDARNSGGATTRLIGLANQPILTVDFGTEPAVLDGIELDGADLSSIGVDVRGVPIEVRSVDVHHCGRGIRLTEPGTGPTLQVVITGSAIHDNRVEGLLVAGAFDLWLESSRFELNGQEGASLGGLTAPADGAAALRVHGSTFDRNGAEGLDCHLAAPAGAAGNGSRFDVVVQDCDFELNALDGLLIDIDYETHPQWEAAIEIRGALARANRRAGIHLDVDARATVLLHRSSASANAGDGLLVTGETYAGMVTLSASAFFANLGAGASSQTGNVGIAASHCIFSGNLGGGCTSIGVESAAASCIAYLQPVPWSGVRIAACALQAEATPAPFQRAAHEYARIEAVDGEALILAARPLTGAGAPVEVADDGSARESLLQRGNRLTVAPAAVGVAVPSVVGFFDTGDSVDEDLRLSSSSVAIGAGFTPPGSPALDAGIFSSPFGGVPGREDAVAETLFYLGSTVPAWTSGWPALEAVELEFVNGVPDAAGLPGSLFVFDAAEHSLPIVAFVERGRLKILAPAGGWTDGQRVEIHSELRATDGAPLAAPLAIPVRAR